jgi:hypothetical protein
MTALLNRKYYADDTPCPFLCSDGDPLTSEEAGQVMRGHLYCACLPCTVRRNAVNRLEIAGRLHRCRRSLPDPQHPWNAKEYEAQEEAQSAVKQYEPSRIRLRQLRSQLA